MSAQTVNKKRSQEETKSAPPVKKQKVAAPKKKSKGKKKNADKLAAYIKQGKQLVASFESVANQIIIWTDGSAAPSNPGPCGSGVYIESTDKKFNVKLYAGLGFSTNNIGELTAIYMALHYLNLNIEDIKDRPIAIVTDSDYSKNVLTGKWTAKANVELIREIQELLQQRHETNQVELHWIKGHVKFGPNELADSLAERGRQLSESETKGTLSSENSIVCKFKTVYGDYDMIKLS